MNRRDQTREQKRDAVLVKQLVGRTIVKVEPNGSVEGEGGCACWMHAWKLTLDDGAVLGFVVEEHPDGGEYGVDIVRNKP